jgi:hypothetical protein
MALKNTGLININNSSSHAAKIQRSFKSVLRQPITFGHLSYDSSVPVEVIIESSNEGWAMLLCQNSTFIPSPPLALRLSSHKGLKHFHDCLFKPLLIIIHDHEKLPNLYSLDHGQNDFVTHIIHDTKPLLCSAKFTWKPRTHPDIHLVDALGYFSPG